MSFRRSAWLPALAAIMAISVSCEEGPAGPESDDSIVGEWHLETIGGHPVPHMIGTAEYGYTIVSSNLAFEADGSFSGENVRIIHEHGASLPQAHSGTGTWELDGQALTLLDPDVIHATFNGTTIVIPGGGGWFDAGVPPRGGVSSTADICASL